MIIPRFSLAVEACANQRSETVKEWLRAIFGRYNSERPHEALQMEVPLSRYRPSLRAMPEKLPELEYLAQDEVRRVNTKGEVKFKGHLLYVG
jgi:hypothetical protein